MIEAYRNSVVIRNVDFDSENYKRFFKSFAVYDKVTHKYTNNVFTISNYDVYTPASIDPEIIRGYFPNDIIVYNKKCSKTIINEFNMIHFPRNEIQKQALNFLLSMKNDDNKRERLLALNTGTGKTFVTISFISQMKLKPFIVVDQIGLADQWKREFLKHSDLKEDEIKILSGRASVEEALENPEKYKAFIAIHKTLNMMLSESLKSINILMNKLEIGIRVFDEAHVNFKNVCMISSLSNVEFTVFLTATPNRSNFMDNLVYRKVFGKLPYYNGQNIITEKYQTVFLGHYDSHPSIDIRETIKTQRGLNIPRWSKHILTDGFDYYIDSLYTLIDKFQLIERKKQTVIYLPTIELIEKTYQFLSEHYEGIDVGMYIGKVSEEKRLEVLKQQFIITNEKIFGRAMDLETLEFVITYLPISSPITVEQIIGRLRYHEGKLQILIDMTDRGFPECRAQSYSRKRVYKQKAKIIKEFNLD